MLSTTESDKRKQHGGVDTIQHTYDRFQCNSFLNELQERKTETSIPHERSVVLQRLFNFSIDARNRETRSISEKTKFPGIYVTF